MSFISNLQNSLYQRKLKQCHSKERKCVACNLDQARTVGLLVDVTKEEDAQFAIIYKRGLTNLNKNVTILAYKDAKELGNNTSEEAPFVCFCNKNLGFNKIPKMQEVVDFINQPFDLLISMHTNECLPLEYISAASNARFRIGYYQESKIDCYDFMVYGKSKSVRAYLQQVETYLKKLR